MGRLIEVRPRPTLPDRPTTVARTEIKKSDTTLEKVAKLVPTEIVAGYIPLVAAAESITSSISRRFSLAVGAFFLGLVLTPIYLLLTGKPKNWVQVVSIVISTIAFVLWAYMLGGPFAMEQMTAYLGSYDQKVAGFFVLAFTWITGLIPFDRFLKEDPTSQGG